jgi:hypothetical protein
MLEETNPMKASRVGVLMAAAVATLLASAEVHLVAAATPCLSIAGAPSSVALGTTINLTAQCCGAPVPAVSDHWIWVYAAILLILGALLSRRAKALASGLLFALAVTVVTRPAQGDSCGGPFLWEASSASQTFSGSGATFSFTPSVAGSFAVTLLDSNHDASQVTIQVGSSPCTLTPPSNGTLGTCPGSLASGSTCQLACDLPYILFGSATSCANGVLTAQTCSLPPP